MRGKSDKNRKSSKEKQLNTRLIDNDALQMPEIQPRSFFRHDDDPQPEQYSQKQLDPEVAETFESVGYRWDYVIVLPTQLDKTKKPSLEPSEVVHLIHKSGLQYYLFKSVQGDELICKIRCSLARLKQHADLINYKMIMDPETINERLSWGVQNEKGDGYIVKPISIPHRPDITPLKPYEFIYASFRSDDDKLFADAEGLSHPFASQHRIKLIYSILTMKGEGFAGLNLQQLLDDGSILGFYPLHDMEMVDLLEKHWLGWQTKPWEQPIDDIRDYFGEKIGLYFEFLGHYTTWLVPLSVVGAIVMLDVTIESAVYGTYAKGIGGAYTIPFFTLFVSVWAQLMLEYWKRTEATKSMEWGTSDFEEEEVERDGFEGMEMKSVINGESIRYFSPEEKQKRSNFSAMVISMMVLLVIACVSVIFFIKFVMVVQSHDATVNSLGGITASIANAIQIQVLNAVYSELAVWLTKRENHRTNTQYEDALIAKLFAFQFVNSYASFFYIAFVKNLINDPCEGSCMSELSIAIATIFGTRLIVGNAQEILIPLLMGMWKQRQESQGQSAEMQAKMSTAEKQYSMETYDPMMGTLEDYAELAIQYGYLTLFVAAFPIGPLLGLLSNVVEIRTDGWKLLHAYRRPVPTGAEDIGTWMVIFQITSMISVITNAGQLCFTMDIFIVRDDIRVWVFILFQYFIFVMMAIFSYVVDDVPEDVAIQLDRQKFLVGHLDRIAKQVPDEDDSYLQLARSNQDVPAMSINQGDDEPPSKRKF